MDKGGALTGPSVSESALQQSVIAVAHPAEQAIDDPRQTRVAGVLRQDLRQQVAYFKVS